MRRPLSRTRVSACQRTARASTWLSTSRPAAVNCAGVQGVIDAGDVLFDDRALVEIGCHVVRGRADQLHAAIEGLLIGPRALESRQERVVDVDRSAGQRGARLVGEDLHVPGQHDEMDAQRFDQRRAAAASASAFDAGAHRDVVERHAVGLHQPLEVRVVRHDRAGSRSAARRCSAGNSRSLRQCPSLRHHDQRPVLRRRPPTSPRSCRGRGHRREAGAQPIEGHRVVVDLEEHAHEEAVLGAVVELLALQDVARCCAPGTTDTANTMPGRSGQMIVSTNCGCAGGRQGCLPSRGGVSRLHDAQHVLLYATVLPYIRAMSNNGAEPVGRAVRRTGADDPRHPGPDRRGRRHRHRRRTRRPQEHRVPAGHHPRARPAGRADRQPRQVPARCRRAAAGRRHHRTSRRRPGGPTDLLASSPRPPARPSTSRCWRTSAALYVDQVAGSSSLQSHNWVGQHIPLHATSNGKVLLSGLAADDIADTRRQPAPFTERDDHRSRPAGTGGRRGPRARLRHCGGRAGGRPHGGGRPDPQRARRRDRGAQRVRPDRSDSTPPGSRRSCRCSLDAVREVSHRLGWGAR